MTCPNCSNDVPTETVDDVQRILVHQVTGGTATWQCPGSWSVAE